MRLRQLFRRSAAATHEAELTEARDDLQRVQQALGIPNMVDDDDEDQEARSRPPVTAWVKARRAGGSD